MPSGMTPQRWQRIKNLFESALRLPHESRSDFLELACGDDPSLVPEVLSLLTQHDEADASSMQPFIDLKEVLEKPPLEGSFENQILAQRFQLLRLIGHGGMGEVYEALDLELQERVALKVIRPELAPGAESVARLKREIQLARRITHPNVCRIYDLAKHDWGEGRQLVFLTMELIRGENLAQRLKRDQSIPPAEALPLIEQLARGLEAAHEQGVLHRDFKPSNVLLDFESSSPRPVISDFGLAKLEAASELGFTSLTGAGQLFGTPAYMSPEQLRGQELTTASDVYAFGLVIYEMMAGRIPFESDSALGAILKRLEGPPASLDQTLEGPEPVWADTIRRCLHPDPAVRFQHPSEVASALRAPQGSVSPSGPLTAQHGEIAAGTPGRSIPLGWVVGAGVLGLLSLLAAFLFWPADGVPLLQRDTAFQLEGLLTGPADEVDARISPDGDWISYSSNESGSKQLFVRRVTGSEARPITLTGGEIIDNLWSPDGDRLGVLLEQDRRSLLQVIPAFFGGTPSITETLSVSPRSLRLVRWIGDRVYLEFAPADSSIFRLGSFDVSTRQFQEEPLPPGRFEALRWYDVAEGSGEILFSAQSDGQWDLWTLHPDEKDSRRLTNDPYFDYRCRFLTPDAGRVVYNSNRNGQIDLWLLSTQTGQLRALSTGPAEEELKDVSRDGKLLTYQTVQESAHIWRVSPEPLTRVQVTADSLTDFWPTVAGRPERLAFQRTPPSLERAQNLMGNQVLTSRVLLAERSGEGFATPRIVFEGGFGARLAPGADFLAFQQPAPRTSERPSCAELWVKHLGSQQLWQVSACTVLPGLDPFPLNWLGLNLSWNPAGTGLFIVVGEDDDTSRIEYCHPLPPHDCAGVTPRFGPEIQLTDLRPSPDGASLAYLARRNRGWELRWIQLSSGSETTVHQASEGVASLVDWSSDGRSLVVLDGQELTAPAPLTIRLFQQDGENREVARFDKADLNAYALDRKRDRLIISILDGGVYNIAEVNLRNGRWRLLTENTLVNVAFSGLTLAPSGDLYFSRHAKNRDIYMLRFE